MLTLSKSENILSRVLMALSDGLKAVMAAPEQIVAERRLAVARLEAKSDDDLSRLGLQRDRLAQDVHRHLYYS